jgi:hypothetical protein
VKEHNIDRSNNNNNNNNSNNNNNKMGRYTTDDFGYNFKSNNEETTSLVASVTKSGGDEEKNNLSEMKATDGGVEYKLYEEQKKENKINDIESYHYQPTKHYRGGENFFTSSDDTPGGGGGSMAVNPIECIGAFCCCITISLVIVGGIMLAYVKSKNSSDPMLFVGAILLVFAVGTCLCGCCALCIGTSTGGLLDGSSSSAGVSKVDPGYNEVQVRFRRLNDRYEKGCMKAEDGLQHVRLDVVSHMKEIKEAQKKEEKEKKETEKKNREELEKRVKRDLKAGMAVKEIRQLYRPVVFYIVFDGDVMVSDLELLRKQVSLVVNLCKPGHDHCVVSVTSP